MRETILLGVLLAAGCLKSSGDPIAGASLNVTIVASADAWIGVTTTRVRVVDDSRCGSSGFCDAASRTACASDIECGRGALLLERVLKATPDSVQLEGLPFSRRLLVRAEGFDISPDSGGVVLSFGQSASVVLEQDGSDHVFFALALRPVERFSRVLDLRDPSIQTSLSRPRAGHTATLLEDGRVLIAGGFDTTGVAAARDNPQSWSFLSEVEIFDPATGAIDPSVAPMNRLGAETTRAFQTATPVSGGEVLVLGGESAHKQALRNETTILFYDPQSGGGGGWVPQPLPVERSRHTATADASGHVLFFGGLDWSSSPAPTFAQSFQWFDQTSGGFGTSADPGPNYSAFGHATSVVEGKYILVAGGCELDQGNLGRLNQDRGVRFFDYENGKMVQHYTASLMQPRMFPAAAGWGRRYVIAGGFTGLDPARWWDLFPGNATSDTAILDFASNGMLRVVAGPALDAARGHMCAATLNDGRMLFIGGRGDASMANTTILTNDTSKTDPAGGITISSQSTLMDARYFHTCTLLEDGSVLVTGGIRETDTGFDTLASMEVFVPRPPAD